MQVSRAVNRQLHCVLTLFTLLHTLVASRTKIRNISAGFWREKESESCYGKTNFRLSVDAQLLRWKIDATLSGKSNDFPPPGRRTTTLAGRAICAIRCNFLCKCSSERFVWARLCDCKHFSCFLSDWTRCWRWCDRLTRGLFDFDLNREPFPWSYFNLVKVSGYITCGVTQEVACFHSHVVNSVPPIDHPTFQCYIMMLSIKNRVNPEPVHSRTPPNWNFIVKSLLSLCKSRRRDKSEGEQRAKIDILIDCFRFYFYRRALLPLSSSASSLVSP